jgi:tetratricopeptide (TPR) repeat protein
MKRFFKHAALVAVAILFAAGCTQTIEDKVEKIEDNLRVGKFDQAQRLVEELAASDSASAEAVFGQGLLNEYLGYDWDALIKYIEASPMHDGYYPAINAFIKLAIDLDYLDNARRMSSLYQKRKPDDPRPYFYMAKIDILANKLDSARAQLDRAASITGDNPEISLYRAEIDLHSYDKALIDKALTTLSQTDFDKAEHFSHLASMYRYLNMGDSAIYYIRQAVKEDDDNLEYRLQLADYLYSEMRLYTAFEVVAEILSDAENYGPARIKMAQIKWALGMEIGGEQDFFKFMGAKEGTPLSFSKHGDFYASFDRMDMASIEYQAAYTQASNLKYPDDFLRRLYLKMVNAFLDIRDIGTGVDYFEEGKQLLPNSLEMMFIEAELKSSFLNSADSAQMMVDDQVENNWENAEWLELAARYFFRRRAYDQASHVYMRLTQMPYPKQKYFSRLLEIDIMNDDVADAEKLLNNLPFRFKNSRRLQELMLELYEKTGNTDKAQKYAEILYGHSDEYMPYIMQLADIYIKQDRKSEARALFKRFQDRYPENPESHYRLANFDFENGDFNTVPSLIDRSLALDTGYAYSYELLGELMQEKGKMDSAIVCYKKAIELHWPTPVAYHHLAQYYFDQKDSLDYAAGLAMGAIRYWDVDRRGYLLLGNIYYAQEKYKMARLQYYKGIKLIPDDAELHFLLGKTYDKLDNKTDARKSLSTALELGLASPQKEEAEKLLQKM